MAKQEQTRVLGSLPLLAAVAFIAGGVVVSRLPLRSTRPEPPEELEAPRTNGDMVEARLWQDPFKAAQDHAGAMHGKEASLEGKCPSPHCVNQIETALDEAVGRRCLDHPYRAPAVQVLTILVRHTASDEDYERRLRNRQAVHTALNAAGMEPDETLHIRYFTLGPSEGWSCASNPVIVPFETFRRDSLFPEVKKPAREMRPEKLIVVWFPEGALEKSPLSDLAKLMGLFMGARLECYLDGALKGDWPSLRLDVIGPSRSQMLRAMLEELARMSSRSAPADKAPGSGEAPRRDTAQDVKRVLKHVTFLSPWSTASPVLLTKSLPADPNSGALDSIQELADIFDLATLRFRQVGITFVRMIGTDDLLSMQIIEELRRRRIYICPKETGEGSDHIALVCERDTFYGRAFPATFATMAACYDPERRRFDWRRYAEALSKAPPHGLCPNVHVYTYNSGIDGHLPGEAQEEKRDASQDGRQAKPVWTPRRGLESPTGRGRLDNGRRLASELRQHYRRYEGHELQAIGVVGSDVYDKMTLLHALREEFGEVALFTTDIDARLLYHKQIDWTRNVIVASNYGLELNAAYQLCPAERTLENRESYGEEDAPTRFAPFRDNYQTALFLACRSAVGMEANVGNGRVPFRDLDEGILAEALSHPRVFEIGRGQAVDLSVTREPPAVNLHPVRPRHPGLFALFARHIWLLLSLPVGVVLLWPVARGMLPLLSRVELRVDERVMTWRLYLKPYWLVLLLVGIVSIVLTLIIIEDHYNMEGEPFSLTAGVSAWPGILVFALALLLSLFFIKCSTMMLRANELTIIKEFNVGDPVKAKKRRPLLRRAFDCVVELITSAQATSEEGDDEGEPPDPGDALKLWEDNVNRWRFADRIFWPLLWFCALWLFPLILVVGLGRPHQPCRGVLCYVTYGVVAGLCMLSFLVLLLLIAAEVRRRLNVITPIINEFTVWNIPDFNTRRHREIAEWLDVRFIARITEGAGNLVYFPSVILLLLIAARLPYFDQWGFPPLLFIVYTIPTAYILGLMATLQLAARRGRATALYHLQQELNGVSIGRGLMRTQTRETDGTEAAEQAEETAKPLQPKARNAKRERLEWMITEIEELREGAFRPFAENPIVHALLIPSGGAGLLAVLTFLLPG